MLGDGMTRTKFSCLLATCVSASPEEVRTYDYEARSITADTAFRRIGTQALAKVFHDYAWGSGTAPGLRLRDDFAVSYSSGWFRGHKCITVHHSRIHHFFVRESNT